jgi:hypothetical protein
MTLEDKNDSLSTVNSDDALYEEQHQANDQYINIREKMSTLLNRSAVLVY